MWVGLAVDFLDEWYDTVSYGTDVYDFVHVSMEDITKLF